MVNAHLTTLNLSESIHTRTLNKTKWEAEIKEEFEQSRQALVDKIFDKVMTEFQSRVEKPFLKLPNQDSPFFKYFKIEIRKPFNPLIQEVFTGERFKNLIEINRDFTTQSQNELFYDYDYINSRLSEIAHRIIDDLGLKFTGLKRQPGNANFNFKVEMCAEQPSHSSMTSKAVPTLFPGVQIALWIQQEPIKLKR